MTTIINTPPTGDSADSGMGLVLGIVLALILVVLFFVHALPALRDNTPPKTDNIDINVQVPADETTPIPEVKP